MASWGGGCSVVVKTLSANIWLDFNWWGGGVFCSSQNSKRQDLAKFSFGGGEVLYQIPEQGVLANLSTNFAWPLSGSPCITDSLSHTTYVETN